MQKILIGFLLSLILVVFIFLNLGKWIDVSEKPHKANIVICLGGGTVERVKKSLKLLNEGYASKILLLGESWYNQPYLKAHRERYFVDIDESPQNTQDEMYTIQKYMHTHHYSSAIIVTDPPHTRRVKLLASQVLEDDSNITLYMVGTDVSWWNKFTYYRNARALKFVWYEVPKIVYRWIKGSK